MKQDICADYTTFCHLSYVRFWCWLQNSPYASVDDMYKKLGANPNMSPEMMTTLKKYEKNFVALPPAPEVLPSCTDLCCVAACS